MLAFLLSIWYILFAWFGLCPDDISKLDNPTQQAICEIVDADDG